VQQHAVAGIEHVIVEVAFAGDPDAAAHNRQFAAPVIDAQRRTIVQANNSATICIELRFHHESPDTGTTGIWLQRDSMIIHRRE
jgi:hypothetical protein